MSHLEKYIKDEYKAERGYEKLAKKNPKEAKTIRSIAKDEGEHEDKLEKLEKNEDKKKKLAKKIK